MNEELESESEMGEARLRFEEARVLGCLIEKEATTPDYYPMTLNALQNACNQKSNRNPETNFDAATVEEALMSLRDKGFAARVAEAGARATKYRHTVDRGIEGIEKDETALLCVLMLRGPQTLGELRGRTERIHLFHDLAAVENALDGMMNNFPSPIVTCLPPGSGRKAKTFVHLLCGDVDLPAPAAAPPPPPAAPAAAAPPSADDDWREELEEEIAGLKRELSDLKNEFEQFKNQLGA